MGLAVVATVGSSFAQSRPHILWLSSEDNGPALGAYGDTYADTPHLDRRAMSAVETIAALPREQPGMERQFDIYVPQLLDKILADLEP